MRHPKKLASAVNVRWRCGNSLTARRPAEREAGRAAEQQWLRFARLYELMDEMLASLGPAETEQQQNLGSQPQNEVLSATPR